MSRHSFVAFFMAVVLLVLGGADGLHAQDAPDAPEEPQRIEVFTGDRIRLTHHDQSVSEGILVSMSMLSLTLADSTDISRSRLVFFDSIAEFEVARGDSTVSVKAYRVERSWLGFSEVTPADSTTN